MVGDLHADWRELSAIAARLEFGLVLVFVGMRLSNVAQLLLAAWLYLPASPYRWVAVTVGSLVLLETALLITTLLRRQDRRRDRRVARLAAVDVALAAVILVALRYDVPANPAAVTWFPWGATFAMGSVCLAGAVWRTGWFWSATIVISAAHVLGTGTGVDGAAVSAQALVYPTLGLLSQVAARTLRRLSRSVEVEQARAAEQACQDEMDRLKVLLHDKATILRLLAQDPHDPQLREALRRQAADAAREISSYLSHRPSAVDDQIPTQVDDLVRHAAQRFADLAPTLNVDLARGAELPLSAAPVVHAAVTTVLHNIRTHAHAESCVVHADAKDGRWEIQIRDDGAGFDPATTPRGFGLGTQVVAACAGIGVDAQIESTPGEGTMVQLTGPVAAPAISAAGARPGRPRRTGWHGRGHRQRASAPVNLGAPPTGTPP